MVYGCPYCHLSHLPCLTCWVQDSQSAPASLSPRGILHVSLISKQYSTAVSFQLYYSVHQIHFIGLTCDLLSRWSWSQEWKKMQNWAKSTECHNILWNSWSLILYSWWKCCPGISVHCTLLVQFLQGEMEIFGCWNISVVTLLPAWQKGQFAPERHLLSYWENVRLHIYLSAGRSWHDR